MKRGRLPALARAAFGVAFLTGLLLKADTQLVAALIHNLAAEFDSINNPSPEGWGYNESIANGAGPVGPFSADWNSPDFGPGQPGYIGAAAGVHAGWAQRIDNGNTTPTFDDPIGTVMTHGPTSVAWQAPASDVSLFSGPVFATLDIGIWNLRNIGRSGTWNLWLNDAVLLSTGAVNDASGTSANPFDLAGGSGGAAALGPHTITTGDYFRLEILENDFVGVEFSVTLVPEPSSAKLLAIAVACVALCMTLKVSLRRRGPLASTGIGCWKSAEFKHR